MDPRPASSLILLVDDDAPLCSALTFALETQGYQVRAFGRMAAVRAEDALPAACLVIDQALPDGRGLDLLGRLRREGVMAPAVLITSSPSAALMREARAAKTPIVEKPLLGDELFSLIRRFSTEPPACLH